MTDMDNQLVALGGRIKWPAEADLSIPVVARLQARPSPRGEARSWRKALAFAMVVIVATLAMSNSARIAVARFLEVAGIRIDFGATTSPPPGSGLQLGDRIELAEALLSVEFPVLVPADDQLGSPDAVYLNDLPTGNQVTLLWEENSLLPAAPGSGVGLLISSFLGNLEAGWYAKELNESHRITEVAVRGNTGFWIEGSPHVFLYQDSEGRVQPESIRLAGNVLLWEEDGVTLRIESGLGREAVLAIAATLRAPQES